MKTSISILALWLFAFSLHAELIKWTDADGMVHYADTLPPDVKKSDTVRNSLGKGQSAAPVAFSSKSVIEREAELKKLRIEKSEASEKQAQKEVESEAKKNNCNSARQNLRAMEEGARMVTYDANGERVYLDDAAREQRMNDARNSVIKNCD